MAQSQLHTGPSTTHMMSTFTDSNIEPLISPDLTNDQEKNLEFHTQTSSISHSTPDRQQSQRSPTLAVKSCKATSDLYIPNSSSISSPTTMMPQTEPVSISDYDPFAYTKQVNVAPILKQPLQRSNTDVDILAPVTAPPTRVETPELPSVDSTPPRETSTTLSPVLSQDGCPQLDLSVSTASSVSSISGQSTGSRLSESGFPIKKRGYMRPQATNFSDSAKSRESVMSLGSIAHLQYYFARTGLLDGKGGQFAKKNTQFKIKTDGLRSTSLNLPSSSDDMAVSPTASTYAMSDSGTMESPMEGEEAAWDRELAMLPPTVSTYNQRPAYVQPPPDLTMLRRELTEALEEALKVLKDSDKDNTEDQGPAWYQIQGLHLLDMTTLAIRAAKNYYTAHSQYQRLHAIKSERAIRQELYQVLEILKRMATRNFAGGLRQNEKVGILSWIVGISELIQTEIDQEKKETEERERWSWRNGDWTGREREREYAFMKCFLSDPDSSPEWTPPPSATDPPEQQHPTAFLQFFQSGLQLVYLHNSLVRKSQRSFEVIEKFHTDTNKPYRCAENLRYWVKAAELRWDVFLKLDVMAIVQSSSMDAWRQFDEAILKWCREVREDFVQELAEARNANGKRSPPRLRIERHEADAQAIASPVIPDSQVEQPALPEPELASTISG